MLFIILGGLLALFALIAFLHRPKKNDAKCKKIPGLKATDAIEGNAKDIQKAGGMAKFIYELHEQFGPVASFWEGKKLAIAHEYVSKWKNHSPDDHIPLAKTTLTATLKGILKTSFGNPLKDDRALKQFEALWSEISLAVEVNPKADTPEGKKLRAKCAELQEIVKSIIEERQKEEKSADGDLFIDMLLSDDIEESQRMGDSIMFIFAGFEPAGRVLMWLIYELSLHPEIQEKLYEELVSVLGDRPITLEDMSNLGYLRQVIDETMRISLITLCVGRETEEDMKLGEYVVPAQTNIYQALGVAMHNPDIWPNPEQFDPDRFSAANSKGRNPYAYKPFGFAGKRQCPGQTYAKIEMSFYLAEWCRHFRFHLVPNQNIKMVWGAILRPEEEIWISLEKRN